MHIMIIKNIERKTIFTIIAGYFSIPFSIMNRTIRQNISNEIESLTQFSSIQLLSRVRLFVTP